MMTRGAHLKHAFRSAALGVSFSLTAGAAAPPRDAQGAARNFRAATAAFEHANFAQAGALFEAAHALSPHPATLLNAAEAWELAGLPVKAAEACDAVLRGTDAHYTTSAR